MARTHTPPWDYFKRNNIPPRMKTLADNACNELIDLIGKPEYIKRLDERFPGPDDMMIIEYERYEWARQEIKHIWENIEWHDWTATRKSNSPRGE